MTQERTGEPGKYPRRTRAARALGLTGAVTGVLAAVVLAAILVAEGANEGLAGLRGLDCDPPPDPQVAPACRVEEGTWFNEDAGPLELRIVSGDAVVVLLDGREAARRKADAKSRASRTDLQLTSGPHRLRVEKTRRDQWVEIVAGPTGGAVRPLGPLFKETPSADSVRIARLARVARRFGGLVIPAFIAIAIAAGFLDPALAPMALAAILLWGALLRLESIVATRWPDGPGAAHALATLGGTLRPGGWNYSFEPYSGDPVTYLRRGRRMVGFYDASDREPFFVGLVSLFLRLCGGRDVGLSFASAFSSLLLVAGGFILSRRLLGPRGGLAVALLLALNSQLILLSGQGWRDETFAAGVLASIIACLRLRAAPSAGRAVAMGIAAAWPFLTRLSAVTFLLPAFLVVALGARAALRERLRMVAIAGLLTAVLVSPYLWSCWKAFGDPLHAINVHTLYYRSEEIGATASRIENVGAYLFAGRNWVERADTAAAGLMEIPFARSHDGLSSWLPPHGGEVGLAFCAVGLVLMAFSWPEAGIVLVLTVFASAPYAWTWPLGSGSDFRFTLHVVPVGLVATLWAMNAATRLLEHDPAARARVAKTLAVAVAGLGLVATGRLLVHSSRLLSEGRDGQPLLLTGAFLDAGLVRGFGWPYAVGGRYVRTARRDPRIEADLRPDTPFQLTVRWWSETPITITEDGRVLGVLSAVDRSALGLAQIPIPRSARSSRILRFGGSLELWWARLTPAATPTEGNASDPAGNVVSLR